MGGFKKMLIFILATKTHVSQCCLSFLGWKQGEGSCYRKEQNCVTEKSKEVFVMERAKHKKVCHVKRTEVCLTSSSCEGRIWVTVRSEPSFVVIRFHR